MRAASCPRTRSLTTRYRLWLVAAARPRVTADVGARQFASAPVGNEAIVVSHGGHGHTLSAKIVDKREYAGYWEYLIDEAFFTAPAHPHWSGAALIGMDGKLLGIGSLLVQEPIGGESIDANMFVPVDLLEPILDDLANRGRAARTPRPWLGLYATESQGQLVVNGLATDGPARRAGTK